MIDLTNLQVYIVGGYVRDRLLGRECKDHDFVVVGSTPQEMLDLGFSQVGADFPVFLHPVTGDEFALARTERKVGSGYNGFETNFGTNVTLEDDLVRRDLTINAMAREVVGWNEEGHAKLSDDIIDSFGGQEDLQNRTLLHVSEAFAEDPLRVLRVARFAARYGFDVAPETMDLMSKLVDDGELDHLMPERVWQELSNAIMELHPNRFFWTLNACGALDVLFPEITNRLVHNGSALRRSAARNSLLNTRIMLMMAGTKEDASILLHRLKAPTTVIQRVEQFRLMLSVVQRWNKVTAMDVLELLIRMNAYQQSDGLFEVVEAMDLFVNDRYTRAVDLILAAYWASKDVSFASLSVEQIETLRGAEIGDAINTLRTEHIRSVL